jgi:predicted enzyme related to lactoylglutathione lyase
LIFNLTQKGKTMASFRYLVNDVPASISFYSEHLGFAVKQQFGPAMAILSRGDLTLWLAGPPSSAAQAMPDGRKPAPGGWNRFVLEVDDLAGLVGRLKERGVKFRNEILTGPGGAQILVDDPSGNCIELFQPK